MSGPLAGLRVVDLSRIVAGPLATQILGDDGADVVKVEMPGAGDDSRAFAPPQAPDGSAAYFFALNRNKRSVTLKHPTAGAVRLVGIPVKLSESPGEIQRPPPLLGEHTRPVLREWLGLSDDQLDALEREAAP